jgi:hypothetical protein
VSSIPEETKNRQGNLLTVASCCNEGLFTRSLPLITENAPEPVSYRKAYNIWSKQRVIEG